MVRRWLPALQEAGVLEAAENGRWRFTDTAPEDALESLKHVAAAVEHGADLARIVTIGIENLGGLVDGTTDVRELFFPGARPELMLGAYRDNLAVAHLHEALGAALGEVAERRPQPLRVLEVGGGIAGTTSKLVPALADHRPDYLFTDRRPSSSPRPATASPNSPGPHRPSRPARGPGAPGAGSEQRGRGGGR